MLPLPGDPTPLATPSPVATDPATGLPIGAQAAKYVLPAGSRRSLDQVGITPANEPMMDPAAFGNADGRYIEALMRRIHAPIASRWVSIAMRRMLVQPLTTPRHSNGADFGAERAWLLLHLGESVMERAIVQSVVTDNYTPKLYQVAMQAALAGVRGVDGLVNCSGIALLESSLDLDPDNFDRVMAVNARSAALMSRHVAQKMIAEKRQGSIVNVSSQASLVALENHLAYCASKAALDAITRVMCLELGPHGIRVNSVNPTVTLTPMAVQAWSDPAKSGPMLEAIPLRRFATPEDVARPIVFLLGDGAAMISGVSLAIDGGYTAR